jgi:hypothetical protein
MAVRTQKRRVREPFPVPVPMNSGMYQKIAYSFVGVTILIILAALWFSSVRATVLVSVKREPTNVTVDVDVAKMPKGDQLPGRVLEGVFEKTDSFKATSGEGQKTIGISKGTVRISSTYSNPQTLVKTTRLLTADGRLYRIDDTVTVPANGTVDVGAYADVEGGASDFSAPTAFTIPGLSASMQKLVTAASTSPFVGGERTVHVVADEDVAKATDAIKTEALNEAKTALNTQAADAGFKDATYIVDVVSVNTDTKVGTQADDFLISAKVRVTAVYYSSQSMDTFVRSRIKDRIPSGRELALFADEGMKVTYAVTSEDASTEQAHITATAEVLTKPTTADGLISKETIAGLSVDEAVSKLQNMPGIDRVDITIRPSWVKRLPTLKDHITVKIK